METTTRHKRFLFFQLDTTYDIIGGISDMVESFSTLKQAIEFWRENKWDPDDVQIYDRLKGITIDLDNYNFTMPGTNHFENRPEWEYDVSEILRKNILMAMNQSLSKLINKLINDNI